MDVAEAGFWLKKIVSNLVLLPAGPMLLVVIGLAMRRRRRLGRVLTGIGAIALFVFSLPVVADALARYDEHAYPPLDASRALPADAAIVVLSGGSALGASDYGGETVNATTLARLRAASRLAARTRLPILVSGGRLPSARGTEGDEMADVLRRDFGRAPRWIEGASLDTDDNVAAVGPDPEGRRRRHGDPRDRRVAHASGESRVPRTPASR